MPRNNFENPIPADNKSNRLYSIKSKTIGGLAVAMATMAIAPSKAESIPTSLKPVISVDYFLDFPGRLGKSISQQSPGKDIENSLNIYNTGYTECNLKATDSNGVLPNNALTLQVDKAVDHKWVRDTRFKQKSVPVSVAEDGSSATGMVYAYYNPRALADQNKKFKIRMNCTSEYKSINNRINFPKKSLGAYAQIIIGNSIK